VLPGIEASISSPTKSQVEPLRTSYFHCPLFYSAHYPLSSSLVAFGPKQRAIGEAAKTQETTNLKNTVGCLKRLVGRTLNDPDIQQYEKKFINATLVDVGGTVGVDVSYPETAV
jgi:molecular chaperone DnaK (HSP70)